MSICKSSNNKEQMCKNNFVIFIEMIYLFLFYLIRHIKGITIARVCELIFIKVHYGCIEIKRKKIRIE